MEACVVNLLEPGDKIVVCTNGVFGGRMADVAGRIGAEVVQIHRPFGEVFSVEEVIDVLQKEKPKVLGIVHAETSTGAAQSLKEISQAVHEADALPVKIDEWDIDAAYSGTQKCLSCPPGLSPVTFSSRAVAAMDARKTKVSSWYLDMSMVRSYWGDSRAYHHTAPINMNFGLHQALRLVLEEVMENRFSRHYANHCALKVGLNAIGIEFAVAEEHQLPMLNAVVIPDGVEAAIRGQLLQRFGIEIGGGLGPLKGKTWRIGLMGESSQSTHVLLFLAALEQCLLHSGYQLSPGAGVAAANDFYRTTITA